MGISIGHLMLVLVIVLLLFGAKRVPEIMENLAKGYRSFTDALNKNSVKKNEKDVPSEEKKNNAKEE